MSASETTESASSARLDLAASSPMIEITVVGSDFRPVASGLGSLEAEVPPGLYQVVLRAGPAVQRRLVSVRAGEVHAEHDMVVTFPSAAPVAGSSTSHDSHVDLAATASGRASTSPTGCWLVLLVRDPRGKAGPPLDAEFLARIELRDASGTPIPGFGERWDLRAQEAVAAWSGALEPGGYIVTVQEGEAAPIDSSLWMEPGWQCVVFLARDASGHGLSLASVHMVELGLPWSPIEDGVADAAELAAWALREGRSAVPRAELDRLLGTKFRNPMLGLIGAHALLLDPDADQGTIDTILGNLGQLVPGHPDLAALRWMAEAMRARRARRPLELPLGERGIEWPPMLRASYAAMIAMDAVEPGAIVDGSIAERVAGTLLERGIWTTWGPVQRAAPPAPVGARPPAPTSRRAREEDSGDRRATATVGEVGVVGASLVRLGRRRFGDPATGRVARYLATVAELEGDDTADERLAEMTTAEVCVATQLPTATVERSLHELAGLTLSPGPGPANGADSSDEGEPRGPADDDTTHNGGGGGRLPIAFTVAVGLMLVGGAAAVAILDRDPSPTPTPAQVASSEPTTPATVSPTATIAPTVAPTPTPTVGIGLPTVDPAELVFDPTVLGFESLEVAQVTNAGNGPLVVAAPAVVGDAATEYTFTSDCPGLELPPAGTCSVEVRFRPTALELREATLVIDSRDQGPIEVPLNGIGLPEGILQITPPTIDFASPGPSPGLLVEAGGPVIITGVALEDQGEIHYTLDPAPCLVTLDEGTSCFVPVQYSPPEGCETSAAKVVFRTFGGVEYGGSLVPPNIVC